MSWACVRSPCSWVYANDEDGSGPLSYAAHAMWGQLVRFGDAVRLGAVLLVVTCNGGPSVAECHGVCGEGTRCEAGRCVATAPSAAAQEPAPDEGKRGRKGKRRARAGEPDGDGDAAATYQPVSDRHIPAYDAKATTVLGDAGSERLDDATVRKELRELEPAFDRCIADAVAAGVTVGNGRVDFVFGLTASGKVDGVNAKAPAAIRDAGIVPCLRKVIFDHRFPRYDGPPMGVDYSFEVG